MTEVKYPDVTVDLGNLGGPSGNAYAVMGNVQRAMRDAGKTKEQIDAYIEEATSDDYNHLLRVTCQTVKVVDSFDSYDEESDDLYDDSDWDDD